MRNIELLTLDLRAALPYMGIENPPLVGAPFSGFVLMRDESGRARHLALGGGLAEGEEELFAFDDSALVIYDADEGPRLAGPLGAPAFYGRSRRPDGSGLGSAKDGAGNPAPDNAERRLPAGQYLFAQFRPSTEAELLAGLEAFVRDAWWEGRPGKGPYLIRRIKEDEKLATQLLRSL